MFGNLRLGYFALLFICLIVFILSAGFGTAPWSAYFTIAGLPRRLAAWLLIPLLWLGYISVELARRKVTRPLLAIKSLAYWNRYWIFRGLLFITIIFPLVMAISSFKTAIPIIAPFYADPYFISADIAIFGTDAWRITHAVIGPLGTLIIDRIYVLWFVVVMLMVGWLCFTRDQKLQIRGLLTYALAWGLIGNLAATLLSSVGPCFYSDFFHNDHFQPLMATLRSGNETHPIFAIHAMNFLLVSLGKNTFGAGISAMPSMHVAMAFLCFLVSLESTRRLWPNLLTGAFAATIMVGSVHLGWHYAVDGIFAIVAVTLIWVGAGRFVDWVEAREKASRAPVFPAGQPVPG